MNRAREQAIRAGLAIVENYRATKNGSIGTPARAKGGKPVKFDQSRLDISARSRMSRLPWRGQFAPELIEYLIDSVCRESKSFLDPFCGSGTVLFEAINRKRSARGCEVNPAAWHLASLASFAALPFDEKKSILYRLKSIAANSTLSGAGLFASKTENPAVLDLIRNESERNIFSQILAAVVLLGMGNESKLDQTAIARGAISVLQVLNEFLNLGTQAKCVLEDARNMSVTSESMDAIITSPPYINVFNYHQNYRVTAELIGWRPLEAARSEIGANRKHRGNRFLTVIQYCLDMGQCIDEMARTLRIGAPLVIVLGRTSNVLGTSFKNGAIFSKLLALSSSFGSVQSAQRVFTNRFGEKIFEDILITYKERASETNLEDAREIGVLALIDAQTGVPKRNRAALDEARARANEVAPSPLLQISIPTPFKDIN